MSAKPKPHQFIADTGSSTCYLIGCWAVESDPVHVAQAGPADPIRARLDEIFQNGAYAVTCVIALRDVLPLATPEIRAVIAQALGVEEPRADPPGSTDD